MYFYTKSLIKYNKTSTEKACRRKRREGKEKSLRGDKTIA